jgi:threonine dehydrogenase-like Zn-dependent dehydrogenase
MTKGYREFHGVMGHEFVGRVVSPCDIADQLVVADINVRACSPPCDPCCHDRSTHCAARSAIGIFGHDGCFAEYIALPRQNLYVVPPGISPRLAVLSEPLAAAIHVADDIPSDPVGHCPLSPARPISVAVLGDGKLGILVAVALLTDSNRKFEVHMFGRHRGKMAVAASFGANTHDADEETRRRWSFDAAVECTGRSGGLSVATKMVRPKGTVILKTTVAGGGGDIVDPTFIVVNEIRIVGSRCGRMSDAVERLRLVGGLHALISAVVPLRQGVDAIALAQQGGVLKVLIDCCDTDDILRSELDP